MTPILEVKNLKKHYPIRKGLLNKLVGTKYVVDGISFSIEKGKTLALVSGPARVLDGRERSGGYHSESH